METKSQKQKQITTTKTKQNKNTSKVNSEKKHKQSKILKRKKQDKEKIKCQANLLAPQPFPLKVEAVLSSINTAHSDSLVRALPYNLVLMFLSLLSFCHLTYHNTWHLVVITGKMNYRLSLFFFLIGVQLLHNAVLHFCCSHLALPLACFSDTHFQTY